MTEVVAVGAFEVKLLVVTDVLVVVEWTFVDLAGGVNDCCCCCCCCCLLLDKEQES